MCSCLLFQHLGKVHSVVVLQKQLSAQGSSDYCQQGSISTETLTLKATFLISTWALHAIIDYGCFGFSL